VFRKYRKIDTELVMVEPQVTKTSPFIQRGVLKINNQIYNEMGSSKKLIDNFLKSYMHRKGKK
jgi:hypothetical protein